MTLLESKVSQLERTLSRNQVENKQQFARLEEMYNDLSQESKKKEEMHIVSDMLSNFYKAFVYINREEFSTCIQNNNKVKLDDFYDRLDNESTRDDIISKINTSINESAYDGLSEINTSVKKVRNGYSHSLDRIDQDFHFNFENYLTYLEGEVNKLTTLYNVNAQFIFDCMKELVKPK